MQREVYADKDRDYCVTVFGTNTGKTYQGCVFIPGVQGCEDKGEPSCELIHQTLNGELCTEVLQLEVLFDGIPVNESELDITWADGNTSGLTRIVSTLNNGTYCVSITAPKLNNSCRSLEYCFEVPAESCEVDAGCNVTFVVTPDRRDPCKKIINILMMENGQLCEGQFEGYWADNYVGMNREVFAYQDVNYCVEVIDVNTGKKYAGCVFIPNDPACRGGGLGRSSSSSSTIELTKRSETYLKNNLNVHPNPFHDILKVNFESYLKGEANLAIYSITGQKLFNRTVNCNQGVNIYTFNSQDVLTSGVMLLQVTFPSGQKMTQRIIQIDNN